MSEVSELSAQGNHCRMKPFQNKMSHNYCSSFNVSLLRMVAAERAGKAAIGERLLNFFFPSL